MDLPNLHQEEHFHVREDRWPQNNKEGRCRPSLLWDYAFCNSCFRSSSGVVMGAIP